MGTVTQKPRTGAPLKRALSGTTALVVAGAGLAGPQTVDAAERIKLGLGGYHQQWVVAADQDYKNPTAPGAFESTNVVDEKHNSEICFIGETTLDNGLTFGVNVQLEANTSSDQIDESYLYITSAQMGRLIVGDENNAGYLLHVTAPNGGISIDSGDVLDAEFFVNPDLTLLDRAVGTTFLRFDDNDSGKITFITPRVHGMQFGISFIPQFEDGGSDNDSRRVAPPGGRGNDVNNGIAGGFNFTRDINNVGFQVSAGVLTGDPAANSVTGGSDDLLAASFGTQVSYAGFNVGGAFSKAFQGDRPTDGGQYNSQSYSLGVAYEIGPYVIGANYHRGEENPHFDGLTRNAKGHLDIAVISGTYQLGPGIRLVGGFFVFDAEEAMDGGEQQENNGWGFATGLKLGF